LAWRSRYSGCLLKKLISFHVAQGWREVSGHRAAEAIALGSDANRRDAGTAQIVPRAPARKGAVAIVIRAW
jgi:hypothetical protein